MEDSPLSITANIAGILTFVVAILASIYVRIVSLRNGRLELEITRTSVADNVANLMIGKPWTNLEGCCRAFQGDDRLKRLLILFNTMDVVIYMYCQYAMDPRDADSSYSVLRPVLSSMYDDFSVQIDKLFEALFEIEDLLKRGRSIGRFVDFFERNISVQLASVNALAYMSQRLLTAGSSPAMIRWYRVRETVSGKVRYRDILRAQIMSLQASMANSSVERSEKALERLEQQQAEVKIKLEELTHLVTTSSQVSARSASVSDSGNPAGAQAAPLPAQQEAAQSYHGAEGTGD